MSNHEKAQPGPSTPSDVNEAQRNLERCLAALDEKGEAGLQAELDRIYPATGLRRQPMGPRFPTSFAQVSDEAPLTVAYSQRPKSGDRD